MATPEELAVWRWQYQEIHDSLEKIGEQFTTWSEELARIEGENQSVEVGVGWSKLKPTCSTTAK